MLRTVGTAWTGLAILLFAGCATGPLLESPVSVGVPVQQVDAEPNPLYVPQGPMSYRKVFEHCMEVMSDFGFEILQENEFQGHIESLPRTSPGVLLFLKSGNPDFYQRFLSTLQSYRNRALIDIQPAQTGGFYITVTVYKELEDLPRPTRATSGAIFRVDNNVQRQYTVVDPTIFESSWIPRGRDLEIEQILLQRLKRGF
jgi:hypothetical protein